MTRPDLQIFQTENCRRNLKCSVSGILRHLIDDLGAKASTPMVRFFSFYLMCANCVHAKDDVGSNLLTFAVFSTP